MTLQAGSARVTQVLIQYKPRGMMGIGHGHASTGTNWLEISLSCTWLTLS